VENPASIWDSPTAAVTNQALSEWFGNERNPSRPFFVFVNYMDAHFPYNPDDDTARLFLDENELKTSYKLELRFPPIEYLLDISKAGYEENDIQVITKLYDACIRYLDSELANLFQKLEKLGVLDETLIIITSDHGEYLGTRNRLAHGLGLDQEVLQVPLLVRYPPLFKAGSDHDTVVTHVDIPATILSVAQINKRSENAPGTQLLFDVDKGSRTNVYAEFRFPLHLLVTADLREDNSRYFMEQKTIRTQTHQLIWKSRGTPEFYNLIDDPLQVNNVYSHEDMIAQAMQKELGHWRESLQNFIPSSQQVPAVSDKERLELIDRLRALGYTK
jgi:arylsulfatase A-like enzyme